jgi:hypothetical protein
VLISGHRARIRAAVIRSPCQFVDRRIRSTRSACERRSSARSSSAWRSAVQPGKPYSRASASCTSRRPGSAGAWGVAARSRLRAPASPVRSVFSQRLASFLRFSSVESGVSVRLMTTFLPYRLASAETGRKKGSKGWDLFEWAGASSLAADRWRPIARSKYCRATRRGLSMLRSWTKRKALTRNWGFAVFSASSSRHGLSRCAIAISASDISSAISRRPFSAARLNHLCAATRSTIPERPLAQYMPRSNSTSGIAFASTGVAASKSNCP